MIPSVAANPGTLARRAWDDAVSSALATATDNLATFNSETSARVATGAVYDFPAGNFNFSAPLVQPQAVSVKGKGRGHRAFYQGGIKSGTILRITGAAGQDSYSLAGPRYGSVSLRDLSIYDVSDTQIHAVLNMGRTMHDTLQNLELACLNTPAGYGLFCDSQTAPVGADTLYSTFVGIQTINVRTGVGLFNGANALSFLGGSIQGTRYTLEIGGTYTDPTGICFAGTSFEGVYDPATTDISYLADPSSLHGYPAVGPVYVAKLMKIGRCRAVAFQGCYYELGGIPATYNDGVHGALPLVPVLSIEAGAKGVDLGRLNNVYLLDAGEGTKATLPAGQRYDGSVPALLDIGKGATQSVPAYAWTPILFNGTTFTRDDSRIAYAPDGAITVNEAGNYRANAAVYIDSTNGPVVQNRMRINIGNGSRFKFGPASGITTPNGSPLGMTMACELGYLAAGTKFRVEAFYGSDNPQTVGSDAAYTYVGVSKA